MAAHSYKARIAASKARLDESIRADARKFGHHGPKDLIEIVRQRHNAPLDPDYAHELCVTLAGWKGAK